jgi:hypothetical protein
MNKSYKTYALIGLSAISISLVGMERDSNTFVLQPGAGISKLHPRLRDDIYKHFNINKDNNVEKLIYYRVADCNDANNPNTYFLKHRARPEVPLNLFTEKNQSYTITTGNRSITIVSDKVYEESFLVAQHKKWLEQLFQ